MLVCCTDAYMCHSAWMSWLITPKSHIYINELGHHWSGLWLVACSAPSHYLNQCWLLSIGLLGTYFSEIWIRILSFSIKKIEWKCCMPQWQPFYPGGDELTNMVIQILYPYCRSYRRHQTECVFMRCYWVFSPAANWQVVNILMRVETMDIAKYKINLTLQSQGQLNLQAVSIDCIVAVTLGHLDVWLPHLQFQLTKLHLI